jgi:hypothetical protein
VIDGDRHADDPVAVAEGLRTSSYPARAAMAGPSGGRVDPEFKIVLENPGTRDRFSH